MVGLGIGGLMLVRARAGARVREEVRTIEGVRTRERQGEREVGKGVMS
jgi:hypothetical protein